MLLFEQLDANQWREFGGGTIYLSTNGKPVWKTSLF